MTYKHIATGWEILSFLFLVLAGIYDKVYHHMDDAIYCLLWAIVAALFSIANKLENE